jgi:hypothetical protein
MPLDSDVGIAMAKVIVVYLRTPNMQKKDESRDDPFWEFGSFGCTRCHKRNLMNPKRANELDGAQLAFVQGGPAGIKLVHVTPQIKIRHHGHFCEAKWHPNDMPLTYDSAPTVVNKEGYSDIRLLRDEASGKNRRTWAGKFASAFRSRREPLPKAISDQVIATYKRFRARHSSKVARTYVEALPYPPPRVEQHRRELYELRCGLLSASPRCTPRKTRRSTKC